MEKKKYMVTIRNLDEFTWCKLNDMAEKAGMKREAFLRMTLKNIAISDEVKNVEDKYTTLVKSLSEFIELQGEIIERNTVILEELKEEADV